MNIDFKDFNVPAQNVVVDKLREIGVEPVEKPSVFEIVMFLQQTYGLIVNVTVEDIDDAIDHPYHYDMHYVNRNGTHSLKSYEVPENAHGFSTYIGAWTIGIINVINAGKEINIF